MSIYIKPNQPLGNSVNACACPGDYCQPIETGDTTILQGYVTPGSGVNLVSNGEFDASSNWSLDTGWTISGESCTLPISGAAQRPNRFFHLA